MTAAATSGQMKLLRELAVVARRRIPPGTLTGEQASALIAELRALPKLGPLPGGMESKKPRRSRGVASGVTA